MKPLSLNSLMIDMSAKSSGLAERTLSSFSLSSAKVFLLSVRACAARANFSMRQLPEGGFQTRPYESQFFFAPFAWLQFLRIRSGQALRLIV
jgi:hypothetical protein